MNEYKSGPVKSADEQSEESAMYPSHEVAKE